MPEGQISGMTLLPPAALSLKITRQREHPLALIITSRWQGFGVNPPLKSLPQSTAVPCPSWPLSPHTARRPRIHWFHFYLNEAPLRCPDYSCFRRRTKSVCTPL